MEIEKHYTSNCEKIVKCGRVSATRSFHSIVSHSTARPTVSDGRQKFYFVALLLSISHFQGATLDIHKFGCRDFFMDDFLLLLAGEWASSQATPRTCTL